jgi:signal transduction histidine kinase
MATIPWSRIRERLSATPGVREDGLRRVTLRLAAQTVGLLLVMVIVLELVVYLITQQTLVGSLQDTLKQRAAQTDPTVCTVLKLGCPGFGGPGSGRGPGNPGTRPGQGNPPDFTGSPVPNADVTASDASIVFVNLKLGIVDAHGALGAVVLDKETARRTMQRNQEQCCGTATYQGQDYLVYTKPLRAHAKVVGAVQTAISQHQYQSTMNNLLQALVAVAILGLITSGGISAVLVRRALKPIRLAVQRQRDFVADAAHELRTPLAIQRTVGELGMSEASPDELQATVAQMLGQTHHLTRLVDDLSLLARTDTNTVALDRRPVDISALVSDIAGELGYLASDQGVTLHTEVQAGIQTTGDVLRLRQLLLILIDNALKHTPEGGAISVHLGLQGQRARLQIADTGPGIDPDELQRIFDRFYRSDQARSGDGSGLGLAIGRWIVEAHGGHIQADNASPHGAVFTVSLPAVRAA